MFEKFLEKRLNSKSIQRDEMFLNKNDVTEDREELAIVHIYPMNSNAMHCYKLQQNYRKQL